MSNAYTTTSELDPEDVDALFARVQMIDSRCCAHLATANSTNMANTDDDMDYLTYVWLANFRRFNVEYDTKLSLSDTLFLQRCLLHACRDAASCRMRIHITDALPLHTALACMSAQHTDERRAHFYPSQEQVHDLFSHVAAYVIQYINPSGEMGAQRSLDAVTSQMDVERLKQVKVPQEMMALYKSLQYVAPATKDIKKLNEMQKELKDSGIDRMFLQENDKRAHLGIMSLEEEAEERERLKRLAVKGYMFENPAESVVLQLVPFASRIFYQLELEDYLRKHAAPEACIDPLFAPVIKASDRERVQRWLIDACSVDYSNTTFSGAIREHIMETMLPMGARTHSSRSTATYFDPSPASSRLSFEMGPELVQSVRQQISSTSFLRVAKEGISHVMYEPLLFCMFDYMCAQLLRYSPISKAFVATHSARIDAFESRTCSNGIRRPRMTYLQRKYLVHTWVRDGALRPGQVDHALVSGDAVKAVWIECEDVTSMLLTWCELVRNHFGGQTDDGACVDINFVKDTFFVSRV